jgi:hypothetical protein
MKTTIKALASSFRFASALISRMGGHVTLTGMITCCALPSELSPTNSVRPGYVVEVEPDMVARIKHRSVLRSSP